MNKSCRINFQIPAIKTNYPRILFFTVFASVVWITEKLMCNPKMDSPPKKPIKGGIDRVNYESNLVFGIYIAMAYVKGAPGVITEHLDANSDH